MTRHLFGMPAHITQESQESLQTSQSYSLPAQLAHDPAYQLSSGPSSSGIPASALTSSSDGPPPGATLQAPSNSDLALPQALDEPLQSRPLQARSASDPTRPNLNSLPSYLMVFGRSPFSTCMTRYRGCDRAQPRCGPCWARYMDCFYIRKAPRCDPCTGRRGGHCDRRLPCNKCQWSKTTCLYGQKARSACDQCPNENMCSRVPPCYRCIILNWECTHTGQAIPRCTNCPKDKDYSRYRPACHRCQGIGLTCTYP